jgi:peptide deformylase
MAIREIVTVPAPVLRRKARKVTEFDQDLQVLIDDMIETMREAPGVGLAAPQVGAALRVIVVEFSEKEDEDEDEDEDAKPPKLYIMVNPEITRFSDDKEVGTEGCLSIPGYVGNVNRPIEIVIRGYNRRGQPMKVKAKGWLARIFQHEIDHLEGVLFTDLAERVWKLEEGEAPPLD